MYEKRRKNEMSRGRAINRKWRTGVFLVLFVTGLRAESPIRVSVSNAPPLEYTEAGQPRGFAVDVIREAARRQGIPMVFRPGGTPVINNEALRKGDLDL